MNDYSHVLAEFRDVFLMSDKERIRFVDEPRWIGYPAAHRILDTLGNLMEVPKRPRMPNILIVGESNNGKSTIIEHFKDKCGEGYVNENAEPVRPLIRAEAPPSADEKGLYISLLEQFWSPYRPTDSAAKLRYQVIHLFRTCHVKLLIIDEFHSMLTGSAIKQREVMNTIKLLCNELRIPVVGVGTEDAVRVLHHDPQHASRFDVIKLENWKLEVEFQRLLKAFEQVLPLKNSSDIHKPETAQIIHSISGGNLGNVHRLLMECTKEAIASGKECIDKSSLESKSWLRPTRGIRERAM